MIKYFRDFLKIVLFAVLVYLPVSYFSFKSTLVSIAERNTREAVEKFMNASNSAESSLKTNDQLEACMKLQAEFNAKNIRSYVVISPESTCENPKGIRKLINELKFESPATYAIAGMTVDIVKKQTGPYIWSISVLTPQKMNFMNLVVKDSVMLKDVLKDLLIVIYIVFAFILCAVLIFAESIQNRYKTKGKDPVWLKILTKTFGFLQLNDIRIIQSATTALVKQNEELNKDIDLLETSLEFSVLNEIKKNNHKIPYSFYGTVSKVDINGFSKVVAANQGQATQLMTMNLENFGCELLQRYEGLFEKTIGDEIVVVFKGNDSAKRALAFSRDLMFEFSQIDFPVDHEKRRFTLKSAIYSSEITFSKRSAGYGFLGDALTFTTRLMDAVSIKEKNILCLTTAHASDIKPLAVIPENVENFKFKNMADQDGYQISQFDVIENILINHPDQMEYFRADHHIIYFLDQILKNDTQADLILNALLKINVRVATEKIALTWQNVLLHQKQNLRLNASQYAKLIMLGKNLIANRSWNQNHTLTLRLIPRDIEGRINASIIDVLMEKDLSALENENPASFRVTNDPSGRTEANMLVFRALKNLENKIFEDLIVMIKSSQPQLSKSGIYAACQIIEHYQSKNPAALVTYPAYAKVTDLLLKIKESAKIKLSDRLQDRLNSITYS